MIRISRYSGRMRPAGWVLLVAGLQGAGCRAPEVSDCQVACAAGPELCPDGFRCLDGMCRAAGETGDCAAGDGDGGPLADANPSALTIETRRGTGDGAPLFLAAQDGDGPWQPLPGAGPHAFAVDSGRYGVVHVCPLFDTYQVTFLHATLDEARSVTSACTDGPTGTAGIEVHVEAAPDTPITAHIAQLTGESVPTLFPELEPVAHDVVATVRDVDDSFFGYLVERQLVATTGAPAMLTMSVSDTIPPVWTGFSTNGLVDTDDLVTYTSRLLTSGGTSAPVPTLANAEYAALDADAISGNDVHVLAVLAIDMDVSVRRATRMVRAPEDLVLELPDAQVVAAPTAFATTPSVRVSVEVDLPATAVAFTGAFDQTGDPVRRLTFFVSAGWVTGASATAWTVPDLSGVAGWDDAFGLRAGAPTDWEAGAWSTNRGVDDLIEATVPPCGACRRFPRADWDGRADAFAGSTGQLTP